MRDCVHKSPLGWCNMLMGDRCQLGCEKFEPAPTLHISSTNTAEETLTERRPPASDATPFVSVESVCGGPAVVVGVKGTF